MSAAVPVDPGPATAAAVPRLARSGRRGALAVLWVTLVVLGALALRTLTLVAALADGSVGLHVDEAQYWVWSRELAWGYASKPPLIAALIALATRFGGDSVLAIRSVGLLLYPLTAAVLAALAWQLAQASAGRAADATDRRPAHAAVWAALLFVASPLAGLLGLVTTTDAPLLLAWSAACALLWQALQARSRATALLCWGSLGVVAGLGLLAKYSFAAWLPGAAWVVWQARHDPARPRAARRADAGGRWLAAAALLLVVAPHLGWNAAEGWPALRHTLQITLQDAGPDPGTDALATPSFPAQTVHPALTALGRVLGVPLSLALLVGPLWLLWLPALRPRLRARAPRPASRFVVALHLPLLAIGVLQAGVSAPQLNWLAPVVPGLVLMLALVLADVSAAPGTGPGSDGHGDRPRGAPTRRLAGLTLALHVAVTLALPLAAPLAGLLADRSHAQSSDPPPAGLPRRLDIWARMRGWQASFAALREPARTQLARHPGLEVVAVSRSVIAQGRHAWRDLPLHWRAWKPPGPAAHHFQRVAPWPTGEEARPPGRRTMPVLLVLDHPPPRALRQHLAGLVCLATSGREPPLSLWLGWPVPDGGATATPTTALDADRTPPASAHDCPPGSSP